jgi:hypothetical protein
LNGYFLALFEIRDLHYKIASTTYSGYRDGYPEDTLKVWHIRIRARYHVPDQQNFSCISLQIYISAAWQQLTNKTKIMKKVIFSLAFLGMAGLGYSQSTVETMETVPLKGVTISPYINSHYRNMVQKGTVSASVIGLENAVAGYNLARSPLFNGEDKLYKLSFRNQKGYILTTFDSKGKILNTREHFKNIAFPSQIRNYIYKEYPGWSLAANSYKVNYQMNREVKKTYTSRLEKHDSKKTLKIVTTGNR